MKKITNILLLILLCFPAFGQTEQRSDAVKIYFDQDSHVVNLDLQHNRESLSHLSDLIDMLNRDTLSTISKIEINSYTSPEGLNTYNKKLSEKRTNSIYDYLTKTILVPDSLVCKQHSGTDWSMLQTLVEESDIQYKDEIIYILNNEPVETWRRVNPNDRWLTLVDSRNKHLMDLKYGNPYRWMFSNLYPQLRNGLVVTVYFKRNIPSIIESNKELVIEQFGSKPELQLLPQLLPQLQPQPTIETIETIAEPTTEIKPLFAVKTNLLYDAITAVNIELEVPIGQRWSVAGEWTFPWWTSCGNSSNDWQNSSNRNTFQLLQGNLEGKYWFGDRTNRPVMTGWHIGLYAGGGLYDFERNAKGYQGEFFIAAGLSGGYAHTVNKSGNLRMEYSVGVGYLKTQYRYYEEHIGIDNTWHTIRQSTGNYTWFGPTRARVSLVWLLNRKTNKGR